LSNTAFTLMEIKSARFVISNTTVEKCPESMLPEYAFIGRSNVGKSSLINMLTHRKKLAKTSGTPGKTQLINHFIINNNWHLVDLPGYGYAKTSKKNRRDFQRIITSYFKQRKQLAAAFVLVDSRHKPQKIDLDFMEWLGREGIPFAIVFTKIDKLKPGAAERNINEYNTVLSNTWNPLPHHFLTSSVKKTRGEEILDYIDSINISLKGCRG